MNWLAPLGFLGLIGVILLIIIYIVKPNYQNKVISSTYVWKLSLKYKKRKIPISKLNNFLIFLCQLLILTTLGLLLARPVTLSEKMGDENERVIIIDASASMLTKDAATTRFERAVSEAKELASATVEKGGIVSVILADDTPEFIAQRQPAENGEEIIASIDALLADGGRCTYSSADMKGAVALTEEILRYNNEAQVFLYTGTEYIEKNGINVVDVSTSEEWNAAILDCKAEMNDDNHYEISIDLGCFGRTELVTVFCDIHSPNGKAQKINTVSRTEFFDPTEEEKRVVFTTDDFDGVSLYSFDYIEVYVSVSDSFTDDNSFVLYGGTKPTIRVQYASSIPNNYFGGIVRTMRETMKDKWNIEFVELKADQKAETEGFDFYIFEHRMPSVIPTDGFVLLVDPRGEPEGGGIRFGQSFGVDSTSTLASGNPHELTKYVDSSRLTIAKYTEIVSVDASYTELAYYNGSPVMLARNDDEAKVIVWAFDLNYSNLPAMPDFSFLIYNMFNYHVPATLSSNYFEIGDTVDLTARGTELKVTGNGEEFVFEGNKGQITVTHPGSYTATQKPMQGDHLIIDNFFVKIPSDESRITRQVDSLPAADVDTEKRIEYEDLLFYFAIALVSLMFVEWILQSKKNF